jgi:hypothetical protein
MSSQLLYDIHMKKYQQDIRRVKVISKKKKELLRSSKNDWSDLQPE